MNEDRQHQSMYGHIKPLLKFPATARSQQDRGQIQTTRPEPGDEHEPQL